MTTKSPLAEFLQNATVPREALLPVVIEVPKPVEIEADRAWVATTLDGLPSPAGS